MIIVAVYGKLDGMMEFEGKGEWRCYLGEMKQIVTWNFKVEKKMRNWDGKRR